MTRIIVVGAGVGGLAVAIRLQAQGHQVLVLEQAEEVGGKLGVLHHDGFTFDTGPSLVTMPHILEELFADTGAPLSEVLTLQRLPVAARYRFPDGTELDMPGELDDIPAALDDALGPGTGDQWSSFLRRAERIWDATHGPFLESPVTSADMIRMALRPADLLRVAPWRTLRGVGHRYLRDPRLVMLLDRYATYTGSDPRRAPAALASVPWTEQAWGSWYVRGGLGTIATALRNRFEDLGGRVETGTEVAEITTSAGRVDGVVAGMKHRSADLVVANADAHEVYDRLVLDHRALREGSRIRRTTPSLSGFVMLLAVDDPPADQPHHQVLFAEDYDAEFDAVFGRGGSHRPVERPTVYISAPDDPAVVPGPRTGAWFVLVNAPPHDTGLGTDWDAPGLANSYADQVMAVMAERGVDVADRIRHRIILTPADLERRTMTPGGSIYGTASNGPRAAFLRPANTSPVPGLYLVGGSSHPGGGLPLVMLSARIVADLIGRSG
ncbi:phytoene desaturase family protein [Gordonia insulae]|uniref:Dehydrosqualene desaturase n=1 Tax=Gordonia insulae TaxID=2420509 RepID=A0A3G8JNC8_9ACTN|nr:phytoene desaturase family protein [Gordonia insulae]AZG46581.1 Dehydrosqualene desaturase [Gordonia insulae]